MNTGSSSGGPFRSQTGRLTVSRLPPTPIIKSIASRTTGEVQTREELLRGITEPERLTAPLPAETVHTGAGGRCTPPCWWPHPPPAEPRVDPPLESPTGCLLWRFKGMLMPAPLGGVSIAGSGAGAPYEQIPGPSEP